MDGIFNSNMVGNNIIFNRGVIIVHRNIHDIEIPFFIWKRLKPLKSIKRNLAWDTETKDGRCFLIANSDGEIMNEREFGDLRGLLAFLTKQKHKQSVNWFYNLDYDTNAILKFLSFENRKHIAYFNQVDYEDYRIQIIPRKELKISKIRDGKPSNPVYFHDAAQFYNFTPLKVLAAQTGYNKVYVADISQVNIDKYYGDTEYRNLWNDRCVIDCKITVELANKLTENIKKIVGVNSYKSKASIARRYVLENLNHDLKMPSVNVLDAALKAFHAGHIETCRLGVFNNIKNLDINSAYPSFIANLYETGGSFMHNSEYESDTAYSFYLVDVEYFNDFISPVWHLKSNGNYHVTGICKNVWITQPEIEYFMNNDYKVNILKAYHIKKTRFTEKPFYNLVHDLYKLRLQAKEEKDEIEQVYKVILNSIFGVTLNAINIKQLSDYETDLYDVIDGKLIFYESKYVAGNMYNPVYGCWITSGTRTKLFNDFNKVLDKIISINTDGVYLTKKINLPVNKKLGDYSYKNLPKIMFMGSGRYFINNGNGVDDKESRFRGVPLKPSAICDIMRGNKNNQTIELVKEKPIKLKESVRNSNYFSRTFSKFPVQDYTENDQFNVFNKVVKQIYFKTERRHWFDEVTKVSDLWDKQIESRPFDIEELR